MNVVVEIVRWLRQGPPWVVREKNGRRLDDPCVPRVGLDTVADMIEKRWGSIEPSGPLAPQGPSGHTCVVLGPCDGSCLRSVDVM
jgi:hypothetical protein